MTTTIINYKEFQIKYSFISPNNQEIFDRGIIASLGIQQKIDHKYLVQITKDDEVLVEFTDKPYNNDIEDFVKTCKETIDQKKAFLYFNLFGKTVFFYGKGSDKDPARFGSDGVVKGKITKFNEYSFIEPVIAFDIRHKNHGCYTSLSLDKFKLNLDEKIISSWTFEDTGLALEFGKYLNNIKK